MSWLTLLRRTVPLCAVLSTIASVSPARAQMPVGVDCYLPDAPVLCREVVTTFLASAPGLEVADDPEWRVSLRAVQGATGWRYFADFEGRGSEEPAFTLWDEVAGSAGSERTVLVLVALLQRGSVPFLRVPEPGEGEGGALHLTAWATEDSDTSNGTDGGEDRWYLRPSIAGELVRAGVEIESAEADLELNYSDDDWRFRLTGEGRIQHLNVPLPSGDLEGTFLTFSGRATVVRTLYEGWSVAAQGAARRAPQNNIALRGEASAGTEWVLEPKTRAGQGNVGVRVRARVLRDDYVTQNRVGEHSRWSLVPSAEGFGRLHLDAVDLELGAFAEILTDRPDAWAVGGSAEATVRIATGLELALAASLTYRGAAIHAPADAGALDPVAVASQGSDFGEITLVTQASIAWNFGNAILRSQDQRWR